MLREAEVLNSQGQRIGEICRGFGVSENTCYRWRREHGGLKVSQAKRMKGLGNENSRSRKAVSDLTLDKLILTEAVEGDY
jgi:putative transposase